MTRCNCGGMHREHGIGEGDCYRVMVKSGAEPICVDTIYDLWSVDGQVITGYTLREQRMYSQHEDGKWSRVRGLISENSLPDET
jgi:hypothetical protein